MNYPYSYGIKIAIIYSLVWFIDLLDASTLNVAIHSIAESFHIESIQAEWALIGFLLAMTLGIGLSSWLANRFGMKKVFILSQVFYLLSSIGCAFAFNIEALILFRVIQGLAAGMAIPLGMSSLMKALPQAKWAKTSAYMNTVTLIAPALGPIFGAYVTLELGWQWIFLIKLPLSLFCLALTFWWIEEEEASLKTPFDFTGFFLGASFITLLLWSCSEAGTIHPIFLAVAFIITALLGFLFIFTEKRVSHPLIAVEIFEIRSFSFGNIIQCSANMIFLGANFLIALYLQKGLGHDLATTGWIMAAITPGMMLAQPMIAKFYHRIGPIPFIITGLLGLSLCMLAFGLTSPKTPPMVLALIVFSIGFSSAITQTANVPAIFSEVPHRIKSSGSALYSLFKQISSSFGIALSAMILSLHSNPESISAFHLTFALLGLVPLFSLFFCKRLGAAKEVNV